MLSDGNESWNKLKRSVEANDHNTSKKHLDPFDAFMHEIQYLSLLPHTDAFSIKTNQNQMFDLVSMVNDLFERFQAIFQHHQLSFRKELIVNSLNISANPKHVYEALTGVITNAIQFCEENGEIVIKINQDSGSKAFLSISNTGKIPDHTKKQFLSDQDHFEKQEKIRFGGIGISLNLIQKIFNYYGGRIWVENHPEDGATFHLYLPIDE